MQQSYSLVKLIFNVIVTLIFTAAIVYGIYQDEWFVAFASIGSLFVLYTMDERSYTDE